MLVLELEFPAGRYHATPWGRNVNEGEVEWPPSPYRLARAIIDVWKRRRREWPESRLEPLLIALSGSPSFMLPPATATHTRSYLSSNEKDPAAKQLIFDAFVAVSRSEKVLIGLKSCLGPHELEDLGELLSELNFLGRSESWIKVSAQQGPPDRDWNTVPQEDVGKSLGDEIFQVACLVPQEDYLLLAHRPARHKWNGKKLLRTKEACSWIEAASFTTKRLLDEGWSDPPTLQWVDYCRPSNAFNPMPPVFTRPRAGIRCAKYALVSKVLPRVTETVPFAERIRSHLMGIHKRLQNDDPQRVSDKFSGKDAHGNHLEGHGHAYYVPLDEDGDGRLDHLLVYAAAPFDELELRALDALRSVWQPHGLPDVSLVLVGLSGERPGVWSKSWISATPFVTGRHYRKGRGTYDEWLASEILKECKFHGVPEPTRVQWIPARGGTSRAFRWFEFIRNRKGRRPSSGYGCLLHFDQPVYGPFLLGATCHFGLGLFLAVNASGSSANL